MAKAQSTKKLPSEKIINTHFQGSYQLYRAWEKLGYDWPPYHRTILALRHKIMGRNGEGLKAIATDEAACRDLEAWCSKQTSRKKTSDLLADTKGRFLTFTNQSLARKMTIIFDGKFGKGVDGGDETTSAAEALMQSAREGNGLGLGTSFY